MSEVQMKPDDGGQRAEGSTGMRKLEPCAKWSAILIIVTIVQVILLCIVQAPFLLGAIFISAVVSIVIGIKGLIRVCVFRKKLRGAGLAILGIIFHIVFVSLLIYTFYQVRGAVEKIMCSMNLSSLGHAVRIYANDNDRFPAPEHWCDLLIVEVDVSPKSFLCPGDFDCKVGESSYAMNENLKNRKSSDVTDDVVLLFDTVHGNDRNIEMIRADERNSIDARNIHTGDKVRKAKWNQHGGSEILTVNYHRGKGCNVVFVGGHVSYVRSEDVDDLNWGVEGTDMKLKVGDDAPGLGLLAQDGETVSLSDFSGSKVLVYFYPKADTPGCTTQACSVRDSTEELKKAGVVPLGISPDEPNEQQKFDEKYSLGFRLLSDSEHKAADAYGVWGEKNMYGKKFMGIIRSSFLIDESGKLIGVWYNVKPEDTVPKAMAVVSR